MDELQLLQDFRAAVAPPDDHVLAQARSRMLAAAGPDRTGDRTTSARRRVRWPHLAVSGAAIAALAVTLSLVLPGGAGGTLATRAWAVERNPDGTITVTITQQFQDPAGLQRVLQADGITAWVQANSMSQRGQVSEPACDYAHLDPAPVAVQKAVITTNTIPALAGTSPVAVPIGHPDPGELMSWTIHPAAMPSGSSILFADWIGTVASELKQPVVLRTAAAPVCTPARAS